MPSPFRLRVPRDERQPLGIVPQIDCDRELAKFAAMRPRTPQVWASLDYWLDERIRVRAGGEASVTRPSSSEGGAA